MHKREELVLQYFDSWLQQKVEKCKSCFTDTVFYSECYGPEYHGISQIEQWFCDWNKKGRVLEWQVKQFIHQGDILVVEWFFKCDYEGETGGFDGVSIVEFTDGKIASIKEFQSKAEHVFPYEE